MLAVISCWKLIARAPSKFIAVFHNQLAFLFSPSPEALASRLKARGQDDLDVIKKRLAATSEEVNHVNEFDYVIINNEIDNALKDLTSIVRAERLRLARQLVNHSKLISKLKDFL